MRSDNVDRSYLEKRLRVIGEGLRESVRREIQRLTELGLPIYVADNGRVIDQKTGHVAYQKAAPQHSPNGPKKADSGG